MKHTLQLVLLAYGLIYGSVHAATSNKVLMDPPKSLWCRLQFWRPNVRITQTGDSYRNMDEEINALFDRLTEQKRMYIYAKEWQDILFHHKDWSLDDLLRGILKYTQKLARAPISSFSVGAVGVEKNNGNLILGVNLEFFGQSLNQTVHAEQFVIAQALGGKAIEKLATTAAPCGHCLQFMLELTGGQDLQLLFGDEPIPLKSALPNFFGPENLGLKPKLLGGSPSVSEFKLSEPVPANLSKDLLSAALSALNLAYTPYSKSPSSVALKMRDGTVLVGAAIENVAFNPTLSALHVALVRLVAKYYNYSDIVEVLLIETDSRKVSVLETSRALLNGINPDVNLQYLTVEP